MATSLTRPNTPMPTGGAVVRPPPGPYVAPGPTSTGPSLDAIAQSHGYADFAAWQAAEPELAQQAYNNQPSGDPSQATTEKPGPRGIGTIPWKQLAINFGSAVGLAFLDAASGAAMVEGPGGSTVTLPAGSFTTAGNTITTAAGASYTIGDNAMLAGAGGFTGAGGLGALSQLSRSGQPPPLRYAPQDQALHRYDETVDVKAPPEPVGAAGYTPPPPTLGMVGTVGLPAAVGTATAAHLGATPPPQPPKTGTSLTSKVFDLLGLGADYLATRQGQNATAAATQQLVQSGQQAKADLAKVYGGITPVLSQVVQRQQANLAPYTSLGSGAASLLGYGLGIPNITAAPSGVYAPPVDPFGTYNQIIAGGTPPPAGSVLKSSFQQGESPFQPAGPGQTGGTPFPTSQPSQTADTTAPPATAPLSSLDPRTQTQSSYMVTMRAPTGDTERVPAAQVAWYTSRGAQVVS